MAECPSAAWERYMDSEEAAAEGEEMGRVDDLARALCGLYWGVPGATWEQIAHYAYKYTTSGITMWHNPEVPGQVDIHGYCEGVGDRVCPSRILEWPYTHADIDDAVKAAEQDADDLWNETHGCEDCGIEPDEFGNSAVNPKCKGCHGHGRIM